MKIAVAQSKPIKGDIEKNIDGHIKLIEKAIEKKANAIFFPELSLTGYEPKIISEVAIDIDDECLDVFQVLSDAYDLVIGVDVPIKQEYGVSISMIVFQPEKELYQYSKKYLHEDELKYFSSRESKSVIKSMKVKLGLAICYEVTIPEHSATAVKQGAQLYIACVAKSKNGAKRTHGILKDISFKNNMPVLMSNFIGEGEDFICGGHSAIWNSKGELLGILEDDEDILVYDLKGDTIISS